MTDTTKEAVTHSAATCLLMDGRFVKEADYRALAAERDALEKRVEAALERLGASLFTNAEHHQAIAILRATGGQGNE